MSCSFSPSTSAPPGMKCDGASRWVPACAPMIQALTSHSSPSWRRSSHCCAGIGVPGQAGISSVMGMLMSHTGIRSNRTPLRGGHMLRLSVPIAVLAAFTFVSTAAAQAVQVRITSPANGAAVAGPDVTINIAVTGTTLVPGPEATSLQQMHVHYMLDVDPGPYLGGTTPIPMGNPNIVHTAALSQTVAGLSPGSHRVTVLLGLSSHVAVQPPVAPAVTFSVGAAGAQQVPRPVPLPAQLPRTGDGDSPLAWLALVGLLGLTSGALLRRHAARR